MRNKNATSPTFEVRILSVNLEVEPTILAAGLFEGVLQYAVDQQAIGPQELPGSLPELINRLPLDDAIKQSWKTTDQRF